MLLAAFVDLPPTSPRLCIGNGRALANLPAMKLTALARWCSFLLVFAVAVGLQAGEMLKPGHHKRLPYGDGWTCDIVVPVGAEGNALPVLFLFSPGGNPDVGSWKAWADTNAMVVVGVNDSRNGIDSAIIARMQKAVSTTVESLVEVHPFLRYSAGFSGGGWCAIFMAQTMGDAHAGALVMGHHLSDFEFGSVPKHVPLYFLWGEKDPAFTANTMTRLERRLTDLGFVTRFKEVAGIAHADPALELQQQAVAVLIELASVTHPRLSAEERKTAWDRIGKRIAALSEQEPASGVVAAELLFQVPGLEQARPVDYHQLVTTWFDLHLAQATAITDAVESHAQLESLTTHQRTMLVDASRKKKLSTQMAILRKDPAVKAEVTAAGILAQMQAAAVKSKGVPSKLKPLIESMEQLVKKYPQTRAAKDAERALEDLRKQVR